MQTSDVVGEHQDWSSKFTKTIGVKVLRRVIRILFGVSLFSIAVLVLLTATDVTGRYFAMPIKGAFELSELCMALFVSGSIVYTTMSKGHISMDVIVSRFSPTVQARFDLLKDVLGLIIFAALFQAYVTRSISLIRLPQTTDILHIPISPFAIFVVFAAVVIWLEILAQTIESASQVRLKNRED